MKLLIEMLSSDLLETVLKKIVLHYVNKLKEIGNAMSSFEWLI